MKNHTLKIGNLIPKFPIIQGGMGIGISLSSLAGAVAKHGGIGIISAAQIGFREDNFLKDNLSANLTAMEKEIDQARDIAPQGIIGVNLMVAMKGYAEYVKKAVACKIDLIISGAGLPLDLPLYAKGSETKLVPIVSSGKAANVICKMWDKKHQYAPDAVVVEGPLAGGHLGFHNDELDNPAPLSQLVQEVKEVVAVFAAKYNKEIPVIAAGGIYDLADVQEALAYGADGVQMATRFVTTYECAAPLAFTESYLKATEDTIGVVKSQIGRASRRERVYDLV